MREMNRKGRLLAILLFATTILVSCGSDPSPIESMKAPVHLVRNDTITEVKDSAGKLHVLNSIERTDYGTAFLKPGDELVINPK